MQVGCGVYEHRVRGRPYLYFWHYETKAGSRVQMKEYIGPAGSTRSRAEALRQCDGYFARMAQELERERQAALETLAASR